MQLVAQHLNAEANYLALYQQNTLHALLPFMVKYGPLGPVYNSLAYYGSNGGVIQPEGDAESKTALIKAFYANAEKENAVSATLITNPLLKDAALYETAVHSDLRDQRIGQITHFPADACAESLLKQFDDPRPRNIRKAQRENIHVIRETHHQAIAFLYDTHCLNMHAIGGLPKRQDFFTILPDVMPKDSWAIYTAYKNDTPIAALLLFYYNQTVEYFTPVIVEEHRSTQALALIVYTAMIEAMNEGYKNWNWGGTWLSQSGVYDFKKRWGTTEYDYFYYTRVFNPLLKQQKKEALLRDYEGFYLLPFSALAPQENDV
jgi:hypothetical protein